MKKEILQKIIYKYHLEDIVEVAAWNINNNIINIPFISNDKDMFGRLKAEFINDNAEFVVHGTSRLIKLINVTDEEIDIKFNTQFLKTTKMIINDSNYELEYILGDLNLSPKLPKELNEPSKYDIEFNIDSDMAIKFIKAKKSVDTKELTIIPTQNQSIKFIIGEKGDYNDKINFEHPAIYDTLAIKPLMFPVDYLKNIFINNKCNGKGYISMDGLLKLQFEEDNINSEYFLIAK